MNEQSPFLPFKGNFSDIGVGDTVMLQTPHGGFIQGRAVMRNRDYACWVLNAGGPHGTPKIVDADNFVRIVRKAK